MPKPRKTKSKEAVYFTVKPKSVSLDVFDQLILQLKTIMGEVSKIRVERAEDAGVLSEQRKQLLIKVASYLREVKLSQLLLHISPQAPDFDDHDQVASLLLYNFGRYERISAQNNPSNRGLLDSFVIDWGLLHLGSQGRGAGDIESNYQLKTAIPIDFSKVTQLSVGILTVLEHEYQSVVRRLDKIYACSGDYAYGFAIRYRTHPTEDLKDLLTDLGKKGMVGSLDLGWTIGSIGSEIVIVICTGKVGKDTTEKSIEYIQTHLKLLVSNWLDVGVCAGSDKNWPIGTVLVSQEMVIDLKRTKSAGFEKKVIVPLSLTLPKDRSFSLEMTYRNSPRIKGIAVVNPTNVPIFPVKFACPQELINLTDDREAIRSYLVREGCLNPHEEFGIEMEGAGTTLYSNSLSMCIVKAVCDYGDDKKKSWPSDAKVLFQLYAAETAADFAVGLVRDWQHNLKTKKMAARI